MNRPASVKPDNFFVLLFRALTQRRVPVSLRIVSHSLVLVILALALYSWLVGLQVRQTMHEQADALGQTLTTQTAASASQLLVANDILSLNVLLGNLTKNPLVAHAAVYNADNHLLAETGSRPPRMPPEGDPSLHARPITFQDSVTGHLRIVLNMPQFREPFIVGLRNMGLIGLGLLFLTLILGLRLGYGISTPLLQLRVWLRDLDDHAPGAERQDEIGDLARQLETRLAPERAAHPALDELEDDELSLDPEVAPPASAAPRPAMAGKAVPRSQPFDRPQSPTVEVAKRGVATSGVATPGRPAAGPLPRPLSGLHADSRLDDEDEDPPLRRLAPEVDDEPCFSAALDEDFAPAPAPAAHRQARESAVLAIQLGPLDQLRSLSRGQLAELRRRYRDSLEQAAAFYGGELHPLDEDGGLLLFHRRECGDDYLANAICCAELLRSLKSELERKAAGGASLQLQLGLARGENLAGLGQAALLLSPGGQSALTLAQYSHNVLLLEQQIGEDSAVRLCVRLRPLATPEGGASIERLLEPYPAELAGQLARLREELQSY
ncbi:histidine kinase [Azotobacter chroococcum]|uniref:AhpA/YtjB family protein n=1 Tax=Azotobacter chroococcum TaxID=353 RepID=UPI001038D549|nr:AhpA/YtjB family protein [Azotobacter chroococcum]TBW35742.1 histidine kinase [Azotobacter chroococcum]